MQNVYILYTQKCINIHNSNIYKINKMSNGLESMENTRNVQAHQMHQGLLSLHSVVCQKCGKRKVRG